MLHYNDLFLSVLPLFSLIHLYEPARCLSLTLPVSARIFECDGNGALLYGEDDQRGGAGINC